jgi:hypothetical protein
MGSKGPGATQKCINERGFSVVDVRHERNIAQQ